MQRTVLTGERATNHHLAATRLVVHGDRESWTRYLILDRRKCLEIYHRRRSRGATRESALMDATRPFWPEGYSGPGSAYRRRAWRLKNGRRFIVLVQSGGLDI